MLRLTFQLLALMLLIRPGFAQSSSASVIGCDQQISQHPVTSFVVLVAGSPNTPDAPQDLDGVAQRAHAMALIQQGNMLDNRGQSSAAIAAYTEAIRLGAVGEAMAERSITYAKLDRYEDALADVNEAIRRLPDDAGAFANRAFICFDLGAFHATARDMATALRLRPGAPYYLLMRYLARRHLDEPANDELLEYASARRLTRWPEPVIAMFIGMLDPAGLRQAVVRNGGLQAACEALFYEGEYELLRGNEDAARAALKQIRADQRCAPFAELMNARGELRRLGVPVQ